MLEKSLNNITDQELREQLRHIQEEGQGNIIILSAAPTSAAPLLQANQIGQYGNDIYWRVGNTIYKFSSDSQITIT